MIETGSIVNKVIEKNNYSNIKIKSNNFTISEIVEFQTGGTNKDFVISGAKYFASFCEGTTSINNIDIKNRLWK